MVCMLVILLGCLQTFFLFSVTASVYRCVHSQEDREREREKRERRREDEVIVICRCVPLTQQH